MEVNHSGLSCANLLAPLLGSVALGTSEEVAFLFASKLHRNAIGLQCLNCDVCVQGDTSGWEFPLLCLLQDGPELFWFALILGLHVKFIQPFDVLAFIVHGSFLLHM